MIVALDILSLVLITIGSFFTLTASIGLARFKDTLSRIHAVTKPQTTGLIFVLLGTVIHVLISPEFSVHERGDFGILFLLVLFAMMTNPISAQRIGRAARRENLSAPNMHVNEGPKVKR